MAIFAFPAAGSLNFSSKTLGSIKQSIARVIGAQDKPDAVGAGDALGMAIDRLNEFDWDYLLVRGSDITITAGTATYGLPTPIKKPSSLRFTNRPLHYVRRADYDKSVWDQSSGFTSHYTLFNSALSGNFELIPSPNAGGTVEIRYYRPILKPSDDTELLDIQTWMERFVILEGQAQMLAEHSDQVGKAEFMRRRADQALQAIVANDRTPPPEESVGFTPFDAWGARGYPLDHAQTYIGETDP